MFNFMTMREQLLVVASAYCEARGRSISRISTIVLNDGKKLDAIANGRDLHTARFEHAMAWFSENWPDNVKWPKGIARPHPSKV